jgi:hypothetical protein
MPGARNLNGVGDLNKYTQLRKSNIANRIPATSVEPTSSAETMAKPPTKSTIPMRRSLSMSAGVPVNPTNRYIYPSLSQKEGGAGNATPPSNFSMTNRH